MCCSKWLNRGTALGLLLGLLVGVGAMALRDSLRAPPKEQAKQEQPKEEPKPGPIQPLVSQAQMDAAQLRCSTFNKAVQAYTLSPQNPGFNDDDRLPMKPEDLVTVPFGGPSYLEGGKADLLDPWGKPYQFERRARADGTVFIVVRTTAPDGTPISQYGIGPNAEPRLK